MEFLKLIAPYLPVLVILYILVDNRQVIKLICKKNRHDSSAKKTEPTLVPVTESTNNTFTSEYKFLSNLAVVTIVFCCLINHADPFNDKSAREKLKDDAIKRDFGQLL
ncbi:hypothetical protein [Viscerimonas tarda]